jgi:hypothetical protein
MRSGKPGAEVFPGRTRGTLVTGREFYCGRLALNEVMEGKAHFLAG